MKTISFITSLTLTIFFIVTALVIQFNTLINPDIGWHLYVADSMLSGQKIYQDFFEVNTPMVFYITMIPAYIAQIFDFNSVKVLNVFNIMIAVSILFYCYLLIKEEFDYTHKLVVLPILSYVLFIVPISFLESQLGQKEYIFIALCLPYFLAIFLNISGVNKVIIVVLAGIGFCIKPFFMLFFIATELIKLFIFHKLDKLAIITILVINLFYYLNLYFSHSDYFYTILPLAKTGYAYLTVKTGFIEFLLLFLNVTLYNYGSVIISALFGLAFIKDRKVAWSLFYLLLTSLLLVFIQGKCFWYHYLSVIAFSILIIGFDMASLISEVKIYTNPIHRWLGGLYIVFVSFIIIIFPLDNIKSSYAQLKWEYYAYENLKREIEENHVRSILIISNNISYAFPLVNYMGLEWTAKQHSQQLLDGLINNHALTDADINKEVQFVVEDIIQALKKHPSMVVIRQPNKYDVGATSISFLFKSGTTYLEFFNQYPAFRNEWRHYKHKKTLDNNTTLYEIYTLK